jgi:hypothetical protein
MAKTKDSGGENGKPGNRSDAVREALAANPRASTKEIIATLSGKGVKVAPTLVYYVKSKQKRNQRREKRERVAAESGRTATKNPVEVVLRVKDLAREVGGIKNLKLLVDLLAE